MRLNTNLSPTQFLAQAGAASCDVVLQITITPQLEPYQEIFRLGTLKQLSRPIYFLSRTLVLQPASPAPEPEHIQSRRTELTQERWDDLMARISQIKVSPLVKDDREMVETDGEHFELSFRTLDGEVTFSFFNEPAADWQPLHNLVRRVRLLAHRQFMGEDVQRARTPK